MQTKSLTIQLINILLKILVSTFILSTSGRFLLWHPTCNCTRNKYEQIEICSPFNMEN